MKISKSDSCIFNKKYNYGKWEIVMSVPVDPLFTEEKPKTLKKTKDMIKKNFNIQVSRKAKHFPRVYYE